MKVLTAMTDLLSNFNFSSIMCKIISDLKLNLPDTQAVGRMLPHSPSLEGSMKPAHVFWNFFCKTQLTSSGKRRERKTLNSTELNLFHVLRIYYSVFCKFKVKNSINPFNDATAFPFLYITFTWMIQLNYIQ